MSKCLDYAMIDGRSAERATRPLRTLHMGLASDHIPIGTDIDLSSDEWNITDRMRRGTMKPIRWTLKPQHTTEWETTIRDWCDYCTSTMDTADVTEL